MLFNYCQLNVSCFQALASKFAFTASEEGQAAELAHVYQQLLVFSREAQNISTVSFLTLFDEVNTFASSGGRLQKLTTL